MSPDQLRKQAALERAAANRERAKATRATAQEQIHMSRAQLLEETAAQLERLQHRPHSGTRIRDMDQAPTTRGQRRRGPALKSDGPVARAANAAGVAVHEIARRMGVDYERVKKWDQRKSVPEKYRQALSDAAKPQ